MSDGDNATPGHHRAPDGGIDEWLTRKPQPAPRPAPWEPAPATRDARPAPDRRGPVAEPSGNHTDGVTVADLIAKVTGSEPDGGPTRHSADPAPQPVEDRANPQDFDDTATIPTLSAYASELPDLEAVNRRQREQARESVDDATTAVLAMAGGRVPPTRIGRSRPPAAPARKPKSSRRAALLAGRSAAALFAVLALALTGGAWQWQSSKNDSLNNVAALDPNSRDILDPGAQFGDENFLIVGVDSRAGANSDVGAGNTEDAGGARSDTVMLVNIPANRKRVVAVSFPRDLAITPMKCEAWDSDTGKYGPVYDDKTGTYGPDQVYTETKLNSAYSFGGPKCLVKIIQKLSGLSINRFMAIDFAGFSTMVDALGGVEVCSTTPLEDYELGTVLASSGRQMVDGHTALNYVRARQVTTEFNGDYGRIKRQQLFLSSLLRSVISQDTFFSISKLNNVVNMFIADTYVDNIKTKDLVDLGQSLQGVSAGRITFVTVPTTGITDEDGNEPPRMEDIRALFDAVINDDPLPGENDKNETTSPSTAAAQAPLSATTEAPKPATPEAGELVNAVTTEPGNVTVQVSNSTGENGLATTAATKLEQHGFNVLTPDDYPSTVQSTTVMFSSGNEQAAATVASALPNPQMERVSGLAQTVQVVLGPDFSTVNAPPPSGSPVSVHVNHSTSSTPTHLPEDLTVTNAADTTCE